MLGLGRESAQRWFQRREENVCLELGFGCRVSLCGAELTQVGERGVSGSTRQEGFNWGNRSVLWGLGLKSCMDPGHHCHFIQIPMMMCSGL